MSKASTSSVALAASERSGEAANATGAPAPDPEVTVRPIRRRFTAEYKCSVLDQAEAAQQVGAVGALLRREGLQFSLPTLAPPGGQVRRVQSLPAQQTTDRSGILGGSASLLRWRR